ncbi:hypothetical protein BV898_02475 [Hypsibius exemplaris]|uniref:Chitin-binding type-2 domain-containing protein n=1 Tax=Hypsibius exemplaris TaxID=2072580 RepID=A0A1W0X886_HYPEX|nr:hypothetical protein BV898_02475 [Hypsibius exemplaris]
MHPHVVLIFAIFAVQQVHCQQPGGDVIQQQSPPVWDSLSILAGNRHLKSDDIMELIKSAMGGSDYPALSTIPLTKFTCRSMKQPGYYADVDTKCQVIRRCDMNDNLWSYLCPNMTVFNQITLVCDWWFNVDCNQSIHFYDYSNSRLYKGQDLHLLDNQDEIEVQTMVEDTPKV